MDQRFTRKARYFAGGHTTDPPSKTSKATRTFFIYFWIAVYHSVFPFSLSISKASSTDLGTRIPNLCVVRQYLSLTLDIILLRRLSTSIAHHLKSGSTSKQFPAAYSANPTGLDTFKYLRGIQPEVPIFHSTKRSHSQVVFFVTMLPFREQIMPSEIGIDNRYFLWSVISCSNWYFLPHIRLTILDWILSNPWEVSR